MVAVGTASLPSCGDCAHHANQLDTVFGCEWRYLLPGVPSLHSLHSQHVWPRNTGEPRVQIDNPCLLRHFLYNRDHLMVANMFTSFLDMQQGSDTEPPIS